MSKLGAGFSKFLLKMGGWKIEGVIANHIPKKVLIGAPHTSAWDLLLGLLVRSAVQARIQFVGKASLFKPPLGWFMKWIGGVPVDRSKTNNFVDSVVEVFNQREEFTFFLAPEGTRKKVEKFKTGFYYIAHKAQVPIQMIALNFKDKVVKFSEPFYTSDNAEKDIGFVENYFRGIIGKVPEKSFI